MQSITLNDFEISNHAPLVLFGGVNVLESRDMAMHAAERFSIPFFFNRAADTRVSALPSVIDEKTPPLYRDVLWSEFRCQRSDGDFADYGAEVQISQYRIR